MGAESLGQLVPVESDAHEDLSEKEGGLFPSIRQYESDPTLKESREYLLEIISTLKNGADRLEKFDDPKTLQEVLIKLKEYHDTLEALNITDEYLDRHMQDGEKLPGRHFTPAACKDPKIMIEWISHDLLGIIKRLSKAKTPIDFYARMSSLGYLENVLAVPE